MATLPSLDGLCQRSTKAGAPTPATRRSSTAVSEVTLGPAPISLNEGRGFHPGDTRNRYSRLAGCRSTKAGAPTPATPAQARSS